MPLSFFCIKLKKKVKKKKKDKTKIILTVVMLQDLIDTNKTHKIKGDSRVVYSHDNGRKSHSKPKDLRDFRVTWNNTYWNITWSDDEGDPDISLNNANDLIKNIGHNSDGDYQFTLYIEK